MQIYNCTLHAHSDYDLVHKLLPRLHCTELNVEELKQVLADGVNENAATLRDGAIAELGGIQTYPTHEDVVSFNRKMFSKNPNTTI